MIKTIGNDEKKPIPWLSLEGNNPRYCLAVPLTAL